MRILHITAHLGGGVGKAHSALCSADGPDIRRHYVLLEAPRDLRFAGVLRQAGAEITIAPDAGELVRLAAEADIVQIEWWNHPRIYECLCRGGLPAMRTVFWSHISGMFAPFVPTALMGIADRFVFTSTCSLDAPTVTALPEHARKSLAVVNSGFGFAPGEASPVARRDPRAVAYLGTVDFAKMSPAIFDVVDRLGDEVCVSFWGSFDPDGTVQKRRDAMRSPARIRLEGQAAKPADVLANTAIFLYLLQPQHFGTAENALIEAMSLGCVPVVFGNPAEAAIVDHGKTGFVEKDTDAVAARLTWMLANPEACGQIGLQAAEAIARTKTPEISADAFAQIYANVLRMEKTARDFSAALGATPADWFLSTQLANPDCPSSPMTRTRLNGTTGAPAKGTLGHFLECFPNDPSLIALRG